MVNLGNDWDEILKDEFQKDYYRNLRKFLADEYRKCVVYPNMYDIFNALRYTSFENTRAVILGQDPYHGPHQAHGLCFSVLKGIAPPPSSSCRSMAWGMRPLSTMVRNAALTSSFPCISLNVIPF